MKYTKLLILTLLTAMTFSACGTDDSLQFRFPDQENKGDNAAGCYNENTSIIDDLYRRDTTMNSMAIHLQTLQLIDPFHGQDHIREKRIFPTSQHFMADPIRALRVARQAAQFVIGPGRASPRSPLS